MTYWLNMREHAIESENDLENICLECGALCCKLGGAVATEQEVEAIVERGAPNHFAEIGEGVYGVDWGDDGVCPYLKDEQCTIYSVRPMGCRMFPVVQTIRGDVILIECPAADRLSKEELAIRKRMLLQRPRRILTESEHHREAHLDDVKMRASKYNHRKL